MRHMTCALLVTLALAVVTGAQTDRPDPTTAARRPTSTASLVTLEAKAIDVGVGQSIVVQAPWPASGVSITDPTIADVQVIAPHRVLVMGQSIGTTDLFLFGEQDLIWHATVKVTMDLSYLQNELKMLFPDSDLHVLQSRDVLMITGSLARTDQVEPLHQVLDDLDVRYVDATRVAGVQQVMLSVRVAEVSRTAIRSLGVNAFYGSSDAILGLTLGPDGGGPLNPFSIGVPGGSPAAGNLPFTFLQNAGVASGVTFFGAFPELDFQLFVQALAENQYVRILAEPTLVALSGEEASFLAGGEFPVPIVQGAGTGGGTSITIEYKEFGVRLRFRPVVLGNGRIRLRVAPEVSELSDFGAIEIEGFRIPTVLTRRAETTLELGSGQSFVMAGLLRQTTTARRTSIPLLGDIPILGPLFRSVRYENGETELVVMVTASLVEPMSSARRQPLPGDQHVAPNDWELYVNGQLEGKPRVLAPADAVLLKDQGLDRLRGPGAWAGYDSSPAAGAVPSDGAAERRP